MRRFLTASHGPLSGAILESTALIAGDNEGASFAHIQVQSDDSREEVRKRIEEVLSAWPPEDEILALTDVCGGNVTNILTEYIGTYNLHIITGMNLSMVLEAQFSETDIPMEELVETLVDLGRTGIRYVNEALKENSEEDEV